MSLDHDGFTFGGGDLHGLVRPEQPAELQISPGRFFAVKGVSQLIGETTDRALSCEFMLSGYTDDSDLVDILDEIDNQAGQLIGDLVQSGNFGQTFGNCTFISFERGAPFFDASGVNGWNVEGRLHWIQRSI